MSIQIDELKIVINTILDFLANKTDKKSLEAIQANIKAVKDLDFSISTYADYKANALDKSSHNPKRMAIFLLNAYGEQYLHDGLLCIYEDDPFKVNFPHTNTYLLALKDIDTHLNIIPNNPTAADKPYDFDTKFIKQTTNYLTEQKDTTRTAWDSFQKGYKAPKRTLDFKSALWKSGHEHNTDYIIQLDTNKNLNVFNSKNKENKKIEFKPKDSNIIFYSLYYDLLDKLNLLNGYTWEDFIF